MNLKELKDTSFEVKQLFLKDHLTNCEKKLSLTNTISFISI